MGWKIKEVHFLRNLIQGGTRRCSELQSVCSLWWSGGFYAHKATMVADNTFILFISIWVLVFMLPARRKWEHYFLPHGESKKQIEFEFLEAFVVPGWKLLPRGALLPRTLVSRCKWDQTPGARISKFQHHKFSFSHLHLLWYLPPHGRWEKGWIGS